MISSRWPLGADRRSGCASSHRSLLDGERPSGGILDFEQTGLLEVGQGDAPSALQVAHRPVFDGPAERPTRGPQVQGLGCLGVLLGFHAQFVGDEVADLERIEALTPGLHDRPAERGAELDDQDEVVEVTGLQ